MEVITKKLDLLLHQKKTKRENLSANFVANNKSMLQQTSPSHNLRKHKQILKDTSITDKSNHVKYVEEKINEDSSVAFHLLNRRTKLSQTSQIDCNNSTTINFASEHSHNNETSVIQLGKYIIL